jgi:hypothetical protein
MHDIAAEKGFFTTRSSMLFAQAILSAVGF